VNPRSSARLALLSIATASFIIAPQLSAANAVTPPQYEPQQTLIGAAFRPAHAVTRIALDAAGDIFGTGGLDPNGAFELPAGSSTATALGFTDLNSPTGIGLDAAGDIFVADSGNNQVVELAHGSTTQTVLPFDGLNDPDNLAVNAVGDVVVADTGNGRVVELLHGTSSQVMLPFTGLTSPEGVTFHDGAIYVADANGLVTSLASGSSTQNDVHFGTLNSPHSIAVDAGGDLFVGQHGSIVELADLSTTPVTLPVSGSGSFDVVSDATGNLYIPGLGVAELSVGAAKAVALPATGLTLPQYVSVDPRGDAFVMEASGRVLKLALEATTPTTLLAPNHESGPLAVVPNVTSWGGVVLGGPAAHQVSLLTRGATTPAVLTAFQAQDPEGAAVDTDGNIFVTDASQAKLFELKHGAKAAITVRFSGLQSPGAVAVDSAGDLFVVSNGLVKEEVTGTNFGVTVPFGPLVQPTGLAVDPAGDAFVIDAATDQVLEVPAGATSPVVVPFTGLVNPTGLAVDGLGDVFVTDAGSSQLIELPVTPPPPVAPALTADHPSAHAKVGAAYSYHFKATGTPRPTFVVSHGKLPAGLHLDAITGFVTGKPTKPGVFTFTVQATSTSGTATSPELTVVVKQAPRWISRHPNAKGRKGHEYSYRFRASGSPAPTFVVSSGRLPKGLHLHSSTGILSGKPTKTGVFHFAVTATNGVSPGARTKTLTITIKS
jgi:hypothetical protein